MTLLKQSVALLLSSWLLFATTPAVVAAPADQPAAAPTPIAKQPAAQLQRLVAPIALYPDALVAQILAASTYPAEVVEADRWLQKHTDLKEKKLAKEVDKQAWDPSVKALVQFPSVLANLNTNLPWTSSLGDAYVNQQQDVTDAVQVMRSRCADRRNFEEHISAESKYDGANDHYRAGRPRNCLCARIRSVVCVWRTARRLARLVRVSRALCRRTGDRFWVRFRVGLFRRIRMGMGRLGLGLVQPDGHLQPQHLHFEQQDFHQSQQFQP